jgi:hypothetical protein
MVWPTGDLASLMLGINCAIFPPKTTWSSLVKMADLPPCKYGKKCYRKNAAHLNKFSHFGYENNQVMYNSTETFC